MSIHVTDFKWEKGKNDLEYIALLEKNIDAMTDKFRECSKVAREQYNKGYEEGRADQKKKDIIHCDIEHRIRTAMELMKDMQAMIDAILSDFCEILAEYEKEKKNE